MRRIIWCTVLGSLTFAALMVGEWTTAYHFDHNGANTPLSKLLSHFCEWGFDIGATFIQSVGENDVSIAVGNIIAFGAPIVLYTSVYLVSFTVFSRLAHLVFDRRSVMRRHWIASLICLIVYCLLWLATATIGTRQVCNYIKGSNVDATYPAISCSEVPDYNGLERGFGCCAVSYAPFFVVAQHAYCDGGFSSGGASVFFWFGRVWPILPWPWGHSWIT